MNNRVCVIGGGYWGTNHIRTLHELGELGGVVDSDENLLDQIINTLAWWLVIASISCVLTNNKRRKGKHKEIS